MSIRSDLQYHFEKNPSQKIWKKDLITELDLDDQQVTQGMYHVASLPGYEILERGQCWIFRPEVAVVADTGPLFELVTTLDGNKLLLKADDGQLYVAKKLDV